MEARRQQLLDELERYYRACGWPVERPADGTMRASGTGGVTWIGMAVVSDDLASDEFSDRILELSDVRMGNGGARCPFELLPDPECADEVRKLVHELQLTERVSVYSLAA